MTSDSSVNLVASRRRSGRPTIVDVATLAGVATTSVSRFLRSPELVSEKLRQRIAIAIQELGYAPDPSARALASPRADVIGVLVPSFTNNVFTDVIVGMYDELGDSALQLQLGNTHYSDVEEERLLRMFISQRPAGLIVAGIDQSPTARKLLQDAGCPVVQIMELADTPIDMLVGFSHLEAGRCATQHLIASGYKRICFIGARMDPRSQRRMEGYRQAMDSAGLFLPELVTTTLTPSSIPLGSALLAKAMAKAPDIDAIFCNNDDLALGALFEIQRRGISVPRQLAICGFNDLDMMEAAFPSLTSIKTPRYHIGRRAISLIQQRLGGEEGGERIIDLGFELKPRASTSPVSDQRTSTARRNFSEPTNC